MVERVVPEAEEFVVKPKPVIKRVKLVECYDGTMLDEEEFEYQQVRLAIARNMLRQFGWAPWHATVYDPATGERLEKPTERVKP